MRTLYDDHGPVPTGAQPTTHIPYQAQPGHHPERSHPTDAGFDLRATETVTLDPGYTATIGTGVHVNIPPGHVGYLHVRSSLGFKQQVQLANGTGVIDAGFTGEIKAKLINHGTASAFIAEGHRFVQLVIHRLPAVRMVEDDLEATERGSAGFGSTGNK